MLEYLSYAQSLRVVGQHLDALGVDGFELARWSDDYLVWIDATELRRKLSAQKGFLSKITQKISGHEDPDKEILNRLYFTIADINSADTQQRLNRKPSASPIDRRDLSFVLRVLGDFLDRNTAHQFTISYSKNSVTVRYDQKQERFTSENLYDFGIHMYLKRSSR